MYEKIGKSERLEHLSLSYPTHITKYAVSAIQGQATVLNPHAIGFPSRISCLLNCLAFTAQLGPPIFLLIFREIGFRIIPKFACLSESILAANKLNCMNLLKL